MNKFVETFKRTVKVTVDKTKANSPEILIVVGTVGIVTAAVLACKATLKLEETIESDKEAIEETKEIYADVIEDKKNPDHKEYVKEVSKRYVKMSYKVAKLYAPSVILGTLSIMTVFASNDILRKRNASLVAAYTTLDNMYKKYRANVIETYGEEVDRNMRYGLKKQEVTYTETNAKGKEKTVTKTVEGFEVEDLNDGYSEYARFFDAASRDWEKDPEHNLRYLRTREYEANLRLRAQGYLFLNDVYEMLDIPKTKAGQAVGWIFDPEANTEGDNQINFGIYQTHRFDKTNQRFVNGYEPVVILDFNVDGPIVDRIAWGKI